MTAIASPMPRPLKDAKRVGLSSRQAAQSVPEARTDGAQKPINTSGGGSARREKAAKATAVRRRRRAQGTREVA